MVRSWGWVVLFFGLLMARGGEASLFCVVDFAGKRCLYNDLLRCREAAGQQGGCVLNEVEMVKPSGGAPFCLLESWQTDCVYMDIKSCEQRAMTTRTMCVANPNHVNRGEQPLQSPGSDLPIASDVKPEGFSGQERKEYLAVPVK